MSNFEILRASPVFAGLSESQMNKILTLARETTFRQGDKLYASGDECDDVYVHVSGDVGFSLGAQASKKGGTFIQPGDVIGWAALSRAKSTQRLATATAQSEVKMLAIKGSGLLDLFDRDVALGYAVMGRLLQYVTKKLITITTG